MPSYSSKSRQEVLSARAESLRTKRLQRERDRGKNRPNETAVVLSEATVDRSVVIGMSIAGVCLVLMYFRTMMVLQQAWEMDPNYSHGYLVPLVTAFFAWRAWSLHGLPSRDDVPRSESFMGVLELTMALGLHVLGWYIYSPLLDVFALVGIIHGVLLITGGIQGSRPYLCAVMYLLFMAPLPILFYQPVAIFMQQFVSVVSVAILKTCTIAAWREGYIVHVPGYTMEIGEACSGLRQLTAFLALSVAAAHLSDRRKWYKFALVFMSVPTAVIANTVRVTLTGVIMMVMGQKAAEGVWHTLEGLAVFIVGIGLFLGFSWMLTKIDDWLLNRGQTETEASGEDAAIGQTAVAVEGTT